MGERLRRLRTARGLSVNKFAEAVGMSPGFISLVENGKRLVDSSPRQQDAKRWADVLGVSVDELIEGNGSKPEQPARPRLLTDRDLLERFGIRPYDAPLMIEGVYASAGPGAGVPQDIDDSIPRKFAQSKYLREVGVVGDCMVPDLIPGETVIYNTKMEPEVGKIMVALRDEEELLIKRLIFARDDQWLHPNEGLDIRVDERIRFLGRAVAVTRRLV